VPIALVYFTFHERSIFLALNTTMDWIYQGKPVTELPKDCEGFVYEILNKSNGRKYVGKKLAKFKKSRPPLKGRKNKRRYKVESDWREYYGSNEELLKDIEQCGKENIQREILFFCVTRGECNYIEAREQFIRKVLESDQYYNGHIRVRVHGNAIKKAPIKK
jgi:hypothetical protein